MIPRNTAETLLQTSFSCSLGLLGRQMMLVRPSASTSILCQMTRKIQEQLACVGLLLHATVFAHMHTSLMCVTHLVEPTWKQVCLSL